MIESCVIFSVSGIVLYKKFFEDNIDMELVKEFIVKHLTNLNEFEKKISFKETVFKFKYLPKEEIIIIISYNEFFEDSKIDQLIRNIEKNWKVKIEGEIRREGNFYTKIPKFEKYLLKILDKLNGNETEKVVEKKEEVVVKEEKVVVKNEEVVVKEKENIENAKDQKENVKYDPYSDFYIIEEDKKLELKKSNSYQKKNKKQKSEEKKENKKKKNSGLDFSKEKIENTSGKNLLYEGSEEEEDDISLVSEDEDIITKEDQNKKINVKSFMLSKLKSSLEVFSKNKELNEKNLDPILDDFQSQLIKKNVSQEISKKICDNLKATILEKFKDQKKSISHFVKESLKETLRKILTPQNSDMDLISSIMKNKNNNKPYVIVFIGVNGVGKSTNLAKVAYMLKKEGLSILIAACDTFRSGAIQQLKVHGNSLNIPVFERGNKDDPAVIAFNAIKEAKSKKIDVVLIDTAGRMQENEPLMKALSKIVNLNQPDHILFIGEAISGNDIIDQLTKFNQAIVDNSPNNNKREIDGIILTKFDTVDEKVGGALSLTYASGKPIVFIGTGQKYQNLKKLNVDFVINSLLKNN